MSLRDDLKALADAASAAGKAAQHHRFREKHARAEGSLTGDPEVADGHAAAAEEYEEVAKAARRSIRQRIRRGE